MNNPPTEKCAQLSTKYSKILAIILVIVILGAIVLSVATMILSMLHRESLQESCKRFLIDYDLLMNDNQLLNLMISPKYCFNGIKQTDKKIQSWAEFYTMILENQEAIISNKLKKKKHVEIKEGLAQFHSQFGQAIYLRVYTKL